MGADRALANLKHLWDILIFGGTGNDAFVWGTPDFSLFALIRVIRRKERKFTTEDTEAQFKIFIFNFNNFLWSENQEM